MCSPLTLLLPSYPLPSVGLMASSIAIPQGLTVVQRDNSSDLNTITIRWSLGVPFVLSEVVYRCSYTLQRTDGVNVTGQTMVRMYVLVLCDCDKGIFCSCVVWLRQWLSLVV